MSVDAAIGGGFAGEAIGERDPGYEDARKALLFNGAVDKRPALIARCTGPGDVRAALAYARANGLAVAIRGGGHSTAGFSSCDGGIVIDVSPMKSVSIDADSRTGRFGAGLTWGELDGATQEHGLAVPGGRVTHTGVAGLTLGSGSSWIDRMYGPTCASLIGAEVVTAGGDIVQCSETANAELLWGLRGGGGNFGVVTEFTFQLHPVGPIVYGGMVLYPRSDARDLLRHYRDFMRTAPDAVGGGVAMLTAPPEDFVPEEARLRPACGLIVVYVGDPAEGENLLRPLTDWGNPLVKMTQPMPYVAVQQLLDPGNPWGICEYFKVDYLEDLPDAAIDAFVAKAAEASSPFTQLVLAPLGGAVARIETNAMALELPPTPWLYFCLAMWTDPDDDGGERTWAGSLMETMRPWGTDKAPPNFISSDDRTGRLRSSFGEEKFARLVALKDAYDPENVFALNQNIAPSGAGA